MMSAACNVMENKYYCNRFVKYHIPPPPGFFALLIGSIRFFMLITAEKNNVIVLTVYTAHLGKDVIRVKSKATTLHWCDQQYMN